ncbi:MAG: ATP-binding protein [Myxococcales bacterium]|nr:ATP-binding protein [Myxococcales bacterium]MBK7193029.1 ATP-binding protein [Myxococcales bacterium]MBP6843078.1 ATP-binding protein [Kofleriaceae bacterium]
MDAVGLRPRPTEARCDRLTALRMLELERLLALALAVRAIASDWDRGLGGAAPDGGLPHEAEVIGLYTTRHGLARDRVAQAEAGVAEAMAAVRALEDAAHGRSPLAELLDEFGLSPLARLVLMVTVAPHISDEAARLYRIASGDPARALIDEGLVVKLLGPRVNPHDVARELDPDRPLVRWGLVQVAPGPVRRFAPLSVDPLVLARLRGEALTADPEAALPVIVPTRTLAALLIEPTAAAALAAAVTRPRTPSAPLRLVVRGRLGSGRRAVLAALADAAGRRLAMVHVMHVTDGGRPSAAAVRRALERCAVAGWVPCLDGLDLIPGDERLLQQQLRHVVATHPGPVVTRIEPDTRPPFEAGYELVELEDLTETHRRQVWHAALTARGVDPAGLSDLAARWRIGPGTIHNVVAALPDGDQPITAPVVTAAVGQYLDRRLGDVAERIRHLPRLEQLVLPPDILDSLKEFLARMKLSRQVFEKWGMGQVATTSRGIVALFEGPPGTGKTMVAGALARELGIELFRVDLSRVMSKWLGETERNLASVFAAAEECQALMLFDEADALFTKRTEVKSSNDRYANLEVNYLLQRLDSFTGAAILTTNFGSAIDQAFKRRLAFRVLFPIPDEELREQLWRAHLPADLPRADDLDLADLARRYEFTGGSVRNCAVRAAFLAAAERQPLSQEHLRRAIRLEYRAAGKLAEGGPLE